MTTAPSGRCSRLFTSRHNFFLFGNYYLLSDFLSPPSLFEVLTGASIERLSHILYQLYSLGYFCGAPIRPIPLLEIFNGPGGPYIGLREDVAGRPRPSDYTHIQPQNLGHASMVLLFEDFRAPLMPRVYLARHDPCATLSTG